MKLLAIESSCDDTAAAVIDGELTLSSVVSTQLVHQDWGGVVPELASREHMRSIFPVVQEALRQANVSMNDLDALAATQGPGLLGSLLVGFHFAKGLALSYDLPFLGVNHMEGHIWANFPGEEEPDLPCLILVISGGHTQLVMMEKARQYSVVGETLDDAVGEAFDKVAKLLGLGYPGGPAIGRLAEGADPTFFDYPRALKGRPGLDFSFSGLKTAVLNSLRSHEESWRDEHLSDLCASFEQAVCDQLIRQTMKAVKQFGARSLVLAGGVAANGRLRHQLQDPCSKAGISLILPELKLCTDNALMIARAAHGRFIRGEQSHLDVDATPRWRLDSL
jgi:N6-L-threonylcarbamoyladenine synthase